MQTEEHKIFKNIECLGNKYYATYLNHWDKEKLHTNWWEALRFFFSHSFMRGRSDVLSNEYYHFTVQALDDHFSVVDDTLNVAYEKLRAEKRFFDKHCILNFKKARRIGRGNAVSHPDFQKDVAAKNPIVKLLVTERDTSVEWNGKTYAKKVYLGNGEDVMMVLDVLRLISNGENPNIYNYLCNVMTSSNAKSCYLELVKMRAISDKIAGFIIRDLILMNPRMIGPDCQMAFPVDTWVARIAGKLGCCSTDVSVVKSELINKCKEGGVDPLKFAAGLWFLGFHSLDILLDLFGTIDVTNKYQSAEGCPTQRPG